MKIQNTQLFGFDGDDSMVGSVFSRARRAVRGRVHEHASHVRKGTHFGLSLHRKGKTIENKFSVRKRMQNMHLLGADQAPESTSMFGHVGNGISAAFGGLTTVLDKGAAYVPAATAYFQSRGPNLLPTSLTNKRDDTESASVPWMPIGIGAGVLLLFGGVLLARK